MADLVLKEPQLGKTRIVSPGEHQRLVFDFDANHATLERDNDSLVLKFNNESQIVLKDLYAANVAKNMPSFLIQGEEIEGKDFFNLLSKDLQPAAGNDASNQLFSGGTTIEAEGGALLSGAIKALAGMVNSRVEIPSFTELRSGMSFDNVEDIINRFPMASEFVSRLSGERTPEKNNDFAIFDAENANNQAKAELVYPEGPEGADDVRATASGDIDATGASGVNADGFNIISLGGVTFNGDGVGEGKLTIQGSYSQENLILTLDGNTITAVEDSWFMPTKYFTLTLNDDGTWSMQQFADFSLPDGVTSFDMVVNAKDNDGDVAEVTVKIDPFEASGIVLGEPEDLVVHEANLANGTDPDAEALTQSGSMSITAPDGLVQIVFQDYYDNPKIATWDAATDTWTFDAHTTKYGTFVITSLEGNAQDGYTLNYEYTLNTNLDYSSFDGFTLQFKDKAGEYNSEYVSVNIVDDAPPAHEDMDVTIAPDATVASTTFELTFGADDDGKIIEINGFKAQYHAEENEWTNYYSWNDDVTITTKDGVTYLDFGDVTLSNDGGSTWTATFDELGHSDTVTKTITIEDGDYDKQSFDITATWDAPVVVGAAQDLTVDEAHLAAGTEPNAEELTQSGSVTVTAKDGLSVVTLGSGEDAKVLATWNEAESKWDYAPAVVLPSGLGTVAIASITGSAEAGYTVNYSYTLGQNTLGESGLDSFTLGFKDSDTENTAETGSVNVSVNITDDGMILFDALNPDGQAKAELPYEGIDSVYDDGPRATASGDIDVKGADGINTDGMYIKSLGGITFDENGQGSGMFTVQGAYSDVDLVLTRVGNTITAVEDSWFMPDTYFTLTLNEDGTWTMQQMEDFSLKDSTTFDMVVGGVDKDGDAAEVVVSIDPFEAAGITITKEADDLAPEEANLANGTNPDADALVKTGTVGVSAPDGLVQIVAQDYNTNPTIATWDPATDTWSFTSFNTDYGTFVITSMTGDAENGYTFTYQYTLNENADYYGNDSLSLQFKDKAGEYKSEYVSISIVDDAPLDPEDMDVTFAPEAAVASTTFELNFGADDDGKIIEINGFKAQYHAEENEWTNYYSWNDDVTITTKDGVTYLDFGDVTLSNDGGSTWTATFDELEHGDTITKTITIEDGDYDKQSFDITATWDAPVVVGEAQDLIVDEAHLAAGTDPDAEELIQSGSVTVTAKDGLSVVTLGSGEDAKVLATWNESESKWDYAPAVVLPSGLGTVAIASITGSAEAGYTVNYSYILGQNTLGESGLDSFTLGFKDSDTENTAEVGSVDVSVNITDDGMILFDASNPENAVVKADPTGDFFTIATASGDIDAQGADGMSDVGIYLKSFGGITFDENGMPSDTFTVMSKYGSAIELTLVLDGNTLKAGKGQYYFDEYFAFALNDNGTWDYEQYYEFDMPNGATSFDIVAGAVDKDGDHAELAVKVDPFKSAGISVESETLDSNTTLYEANLENGTASDADALVKSGSMNITAPDGLASVKVDLFSSYSSPIATWNKESGVWELSEEGMDFGYGNVRIDSILGNAKDGYTVNFTYTMTQTADHPYGDTTESIWLVYTDASGKTAREDIFMKVIDDMVPVHEDVDVTIAHDALSASTTFDLIFGADDDGKSIEINDIKVIYNAKTNSWTNSDWNWQGGGDAVINQDGTTTTIDFGDVTLTNKGGKEWTMTFDDMVVGGTASKEIILGDGDTTSMNPDEQSFTVSATWKAPSLEDITADLLADTPYEDRLLEYFAGPQDVKAADELAQSLVDALTYKKLAARDNIGDDKAERQEYNELKEQMDKGTNKDDTFFGEEEILIGLKGNDFFDVNAHNRIILGGKGDDLIKMDDLSIDDVLVDGGDGMDVLLTGINNLDTVKELISEGKINNIDMFVLGDSADTANAKSVTDVLNGINGTEDATANPPVELADKWTEKASHTLNGVEYREYKNDTDDMTILISKEVMNIG